MTNNIENNLIHFLNLILNLPNYISNHEEINKMREELEKFLHDSGLSKGNNKPAMVTIARSEEDGHTPQKLRSFIEKQVYIMLHNAFVSRVVPHEKKVSFFDGY